MTLFFDHKVPNLIPALPKFESLRNILPRICLELTFNGLVSYSGAVKDFHPLKSMETRDKRQLQVPLGLARTILSSKNKNS